MGLKFYLANCPYFSSLDIHLRHYKTMFVEVDWEKDGGKELFPPSEIPSNLVYFDTPLSNFLSLKGNGKNYP